MRVEKGLILIIAFSVIFLITGLTFAQEQAQESAPAKAEEQVSAQPVVEAVAPVETATPAQLEAEVSAQVQAATPAAPAVEAKAEPEIQWVWGEVVSTNPINNELLVKYVDYDTDSEKEITIGTDDKTTYENAKSIDEIKVRDSVSIDYAVSVDGKNLALNISLEKPETIEESPATETTPAEAPNEDNAVATP